MGLRRKARELAVQTLYALNYIDIIDDFKEFNLLNAFPDVLSEIAKHEDLKFDNQAIPFAEELLRNTIIHAEEIDKQIEKHLNNLSIDRIVPIDHCILKIAGYELLFTDTPSAVVINEAIEIAKKFSSEGSTKFVNGILDAIKLDIKP